MNYKPRPGIVCTKICGRNVLIPTREASAYCRTIQMLSGFRFLTWQSLSNGGTVETLAVLFALLKKKPEEECREEVEQFCRTLAERGFLEEVPDEAPGTGQESP